MDGMEKTTVTPNKALKEASAPSAEIEIRIGLGRRLSNRLHQAHPSAGQGSHNRQERRKSVQDHRRRNKGDAPLALSAFTAGLLEKAGVT